MDALEALKLAKETGAKVRPKYAKRYYSKFIGDDLYVHEVNGSIHEGSENTVHWMALIDDDGSPVEWEIVPA